MSNNRGLAAAKEIYQNRDRRARELKGEGKNIIGYLCCYPPLEIITAAGAVPYRIMGNVREPVTQADAYLEPIWCPYIRSCFDLAIKGKFDFLEGFVSPHSCDIVQRIYDIWKYYIKPAYSHFIDVPHMVDYPSSHQFFKEGLTRFKKSIEEFTANSISDQSLLEAIELHNRNRALMRQLYELRKQDPPLLSGTEVTQVIVASMSLPAEEANELVSGVIEEVKGRKDGPEKKSARVLVYGSEIDDVAFIEMVEESGANVVMDDLCIGTRHHWHEVEKTKDPLDGIVSRYLEKIMCPRTYRAGKANERLRYLFDYAKEFNANAVILYIIRFCDTHEFDVPDVRDYLREMGLPVLHIEDDYSTTTMMQFKTRVQAFLEMIA